MDLTLIRTSLIQVEIWVDNKSNMISYELNSILSAMEISTYYNRVYESSFPNRNHTFYVLRYVLPELTISYSNVISDLSAVRISEGLPYL